MSCATASADAKGSSAIRKSTAARCSRSRIARRQADLQRRASFQTRKGRCSTLNCRIILSLNRFRFEELCLVLTCCG
ncbi:hypothetical protein ELI49_02155 [Rhizobium ruizarguesonis]|uniref:Uncharacterized protein n=1 Tax=Rhizobium ruizarguesonis TaxID=2081791 RepID=A0ABY1X432_9HYPH|nr:hypothetical protein [Rhizobium leguminosarum bv. viciae]NKQ80007.1 hypothetical protein [Rhizobium ruizarguesonis]NKL16094.1 hypothetical protein [Rhizobium leguminosarum bv. viciae]NKL28945.1 hypothetical protein [Rhizobium leguminosarum bv. viciae]NKL41153.1 hypothetical protein [Rhizobium leguminosarum bv. viciae]